MRYFMAALITVYHDFQVFNPVLTKSLKPNKFKLDKKKFLKKEMR